MREEGVERRGDKRGGEGERRVGVSKNSVIIYRRWKLKRMC